MIYQIGIPSWETEADRESDLSSRVFGVERAVG